MVTSSKFIKFLLGWCFVGVALLFLIFASWLQRYKEASLFLGCCASGVPNNVFKSIFFRRNKISIFDKNTGKRFVRTFYLAGVAKFFVFVTIFILSLLLVPNHAAMFLTGFVTVELLYLLLKRSYLLAPHRLTSIGECA